MFDSALSVGDNGAVNEVVEEDLRFEDNGFVSGVRS